MNNNTTALLALALTGGLLPAHARAAEDTGAPGEPAAADWIEGRALVKFAADTPRDEQAAIRAEAGATVVDTLAPIGVELWELASLSTEEAVAELTGDDALVFIEPDYLVEVAASAPNDYRFGDQWALHNDGLSGGTADADIDAPEAWDVTTSAGAVIAILDTGIDLGHVNLAANLWVNPAEASGAPGVDDDGNGFIDDVNGYDFAYGDGDPTDVYGHGTHVAGIAAAAGDDGVGTAGVAWSGELMAVKVLGDYGGGSSSTIAKGILYAVDNGARVLNASYGSYSGSQTQHDAIEYAGQHGALFVAAAGNDEQDIDVTPFYPAAFRLDNIISMTSTDSDDDQTDNYGAVSVDLGAPGRNILSTVPGDAYGSMWGTSMAAPHVSGAAALAWAVRPSLTAVEVKQAILDATDPLPGLQGITVSGGRLNLANLLWGLSCQAPPTGDWHVLVDCTVSALESSAGDVFVADGVTLTVAATGAVQVDFSTHHLVVGDGSRLLIEAGGAVFE